MDDMDAALARALQEEEFAIARQHPGQDERASLFGQLEGCMAKVIKVQETTTGKHTIQLLMLFKSDQSPKASRSLLLAVNPALHLRDTSHLTPLTITLTLV